MLFNFLRFATLALVAGFLSTALAHDTGHRVDAGPVVSAASDERLEGVVEEITIDDRTTKTSYVQRELRLADGRAVALEGQAAQALTAGMRVKVDGRRSGNYFVIGGVQASGRAETPKSTVTTADVDGMLAIAHFDNFASGRGEFLYELVDADEKRVRIEVAALPPPLQPGQHLRIAGQASADGSTIRPSRIVILEAAPQPHSAKDGAVAAKAVNTVLVIMANFSNTATPAFTQAQAQQVMVSNAGSVANYYNEVSYGGQSLSVTVTDWVVMNKSLPATCSNADWQSIGTAATAAASGANGAWNAANYGFVVFLFPGVSACGWNGLAYIGSPHRAYINGTNSFITQVITHEMGHNFGLLHAGSLDCGSATIGGACSVSEYGDPFDTMGNQRAMHFNAQQKRKLNWIAAATAPTHAGGTATYSLAPLETPGAGTYAVRVPTANSNRTYWIEFRQPIGFDSPLAAFPNNGAQIRVASPFETLCPGCDSFSNDTELVDMTPATSTFTDAALLAGQTYTDATYGVTINVLAASASALTVQVSTGGAQGASTTTLASSANPASAGASVTFTATVTGNAPTGTVAFADGASTLSGCGAVALAGSGNARTATCTSSSLGGGSHGITATYSGDGANAASSSTTLTQTINVAATTTGLAASANPVATGTTVVLTASVTGTSPTGAVSFTDGGIAISGCTGSGFSGGSGNIRTATCSTSALPAGTHSIVASYSGDASNASSSSPPLSLIVSAAAPSGTNFALAANGGVATASSTYSTAFPIAAINDGDLTQSRWGNGGGWNDATVSAFPDWVQIQFNGTKAVSRVVLHTLSDVYWTEGAASDSETFTQSGIVDFNVQAWNGSGWVTVATVTGNNLVKRTVTFAAVTTDRLRINVTNALSGYARIVELEAWGTAVAGSAANVALASNGGVATASSFIGNGFPVASLNDNVRTGGTWGSGGGWNDATSNAFPDWAQVAFNGFKTIDRVVVYTLSDTYWVNAEPSDIQTFTQFGIVDFNVQAWNGSSWVTVATVTGNNLVKRTVTFSPLAADRVRINVTNALASYSRIVEIEAWGQ